MTEDQNPKTEQSRLDAAQKHEALDTLRDPLFDAITKATSEFCSTPTALISFVDRDLLWVKSAIGFEGLEPSLALSFCEHTLMLPDEEFDVFEVCDASIDDRFANSPLVVPVNGFKHYAGVTLQSEKGRGLGTLSVLDHKPGSLSTRQKHALRHMADVVMSLVRERVQQPSFRSDKVFEDDSFRGIFVLDATNGFTVSYCNLGYEKLTGHTRKDIVGQSFESLNGESENRAFTRRILNDLSKTRETAVVYSNRRIQGKLRSTRLTLCPIFNASDSLVQVLCIQENISRNASENKELTRARLFLESAPDATLIMSETGAIILANREAEYLFGYRYEEFLTMSIESLMPERFRSKHRQYRKQYFRTPNVREMGQGMNIIALTKKGVEIPVDIRLSPIYSDGTLFYSASIRDITNHVRAEVALEKAKSAAERATEQKTRFLAAASHDMRQPLQAIGLYLSLLSRTNDEEKRSEITQKVQLSLENVNGMLGALLDVSKLDSGAIRPEKVDVRLQNVFERIIASNSQQAASKGLTLTCSPTEEIVFTDPVLLERVLDNFMTNAIRYTVTGEVGIDAKLNNESVIVSVTDSGIGIDDSQLDKIFDEYYQLANPNRSRSKGLGLGLAIVKYIAKLLDHNIDVKSDPGVGSSFSITVPRANPNLDGKQNQSLDTIQSNSGSRRLKILLVEDDPEVLDATELLLESEGMEVQTARSAQEGLAYVAERDFPELVIADYRLPDLNGCELIARLRAQSGIEIPSIVVTGDIEPPEFVGQKISNCSLLYKPVAPEHLLNRIKELVK